MYVNVNTHFLGFIISPRILCDSDTLNGVLKRLDEHKKEAAHLKNELKASQESQTILLERFNAVEREVTASKKEYSEYVPPTVQ